ncbi:MAG TPA: hypothetical protein VKB25_10600 [Conexibacter sp.]|nr:hypothetical protein [Conexibacter sp.]
MTDAPAQAANNGGPTVEHAALAPDAAAPAGAVSPGVPSALPPTSARGGVPDERPELVVGAAFAGGLALALFLKRLAR